MLFSILTPSYPLLEDDFMKKRYSLVLPPLLLVKSPVAADMYCDMNTIIGGSRR